MTFKEILIAAIELGRTDTLLGYAGKHSRRASERKIARRLGVTVGTIRGWAYGATAPCPGIEDAVRDVIRFGV